MFVYNGYIFLSSCAATCATKSVVYLISCNKCNKQYLGETTQALWVRFNQHTRFGSINIRTNAVCNKKKDTLIFRHFHQMDHAANDVQIRVLQVINYCEQKAAVNLPVISGLRYTIQFS